MLKSWLFSSWAFCYWRRAWVPDLVAVKAEKLTGKGTTTLGTKFEVLPVSAKFSSVALLLLAVLSIAVRMPVLVLLAFPWSKLYKVTSPVSLPVRVAPMLAIIWAGV